MSWGTKSWGYSPWGDPAPSVVAPASTYDAQSSKTANFSFYFVHISGFPYLWTTDHGIADNWTPPAGFTIRPGLLLTPHDEVASFVVSNEMDIFSGVEDADSIDITICDTLLHSLFATRRPMTTANAAEIVTNNIAAGSDADIVVESDITDAPASNGTIYIGNQTITYLSKNGTTFSGIDRGRYAILNSHLNEDRWKPFTDWDDTMDIPLMVTTFPQRIEGRVLTVYRCYRNPDTIVPLAKEESQIRFRGKITAYGMQSTPNGYDIHATSIIAELDQEVMSKAASCELSGYALVNASLDDVQKYSQTYIELTIQEDWLILDGTSADAMAVNRFTVDGNMVHHIQIDSSQYLFNGVDDLIAAINAQLAYEYSDGNMLAPWFVSRGQNGHLVIGYHSVGYGVDLDIVDMYPNTNVWAHTIYRIPQGNTLGYLDDYKYKLVAGVKGSVMANFPISALGFGDPDGKMIEVGSSDSVAYLHNAAIYINASNSEYSGYLIEVDGEVAPYEPQKALGTEEAAMAWFRMDYATRIPTNVVTEDGFVESIGDESQFLVKVGDEIIYRISHIDTVSQDFIPVNAPDDYWTPIASSKTPDDEYISVPESATGESVPKVRQVFMPTGLYEMSDTVYIGETPVVVTKRYNGVNFTILQLMASTGTSEYNGDFDILPRGWGLGIPEQYIDVASFRDLHDQYPFDALQRRWIFDSPMSFREFLEAEAKTLGFLVMVREGKITAVQSEKLATNGSAVATIDDTMRIMGSEVSWRTSPEGIYNLVKLSLDYDYIESKYFTTEEYHDRASQTDSRMVNAIEVENKGLASRNFRGASDSSLSAIRTMMLDRLMSYSREAYEYTCSVCRKADGLNVGDIVYVTDDRIPNHLDGSVGISWHMGRITRYEFDELAGMGEITVRLNYEFNHEIKAFVDVSYWNSPQFSPSAQIESWVADNQAVINTTLYNPDGFSDSQKILITDMTTGEQWVAGIDSIDLTTGDIAFDTSLSNARASANELIVNFADFDTVESDSEDGSEFEAAYIGSGRYYLG